MITSLASNLMPLHANARFITLTFFFSDKIDVFQNYNYPHFLNLLLCHMFNLFVSSYFLFIWHESRFV